MTGTPERLDEPTDIADMAKLGEKLNAIGWGLFFVWVGFALLVDIGWGFGLLGIGVITLGEQYARKYYQLNVEGFWIVVGILFVAGGLWELVNFQWPLVPLMLIAAGVIVLVFAFGGRHVLKR